MLDTSKLYDAVGGDRGGWSTEHEDDIVQRFRNDDNFDVPIELTDLDLWTNYINEDLYVMDKKLREFLKKTRWKRKSKGGYKTTASLVFSWIYGRQPEPADGPACKMLHELLKYYCTSYIDNTTYMGKKVSRVYEFSKYAFSNKRPYSLKLRLEEAEDGKNPFRASGAGNPDKQRHGRRKHSEDGKPKDA